MKVPVPTPVEVVKKVPYIVEKPVPYPVHVPIDRPVYHEKPVHFPVHAERPVAVKVAVEPPKHFHSEPIHVSDNYEHHHDHHHEPHHAYTSFSGYGSQYSYHH